MVQTTVKPKKTDFNMTVSLPKDYVGKNVHVLFYIDEEVKNTIVSETSTNKKASDFIGSLSKKEGEKMQKYITKSRNEWERNL